MVLELDGERVIKCVPHIGYLHTGIEKLSEHHNYTQNITHYCRMDYLAPINNELAYCLAVEKLIGEEIPARASYIRVLMHELTRIISHLVWIGSHAIDMGASSVLLYAFGEREKIIDFYEMVGGQRMMTSYMRIGGVKEDLPEGFEELLRAWAPGCLQDHRDDRRAADARTRSGSSARKTSALPEPRDRAELWRAGPAAARQRREVTTCARTSRTAALRSSTSRCRCARSAMSTRGTKCAWKRCASR